MTASSLERWKFKNKTVDVLIVRQLTILRAPTPGRVGNCPARAHPGQTSDFRRLESWVHGPADAIGQRRPQRQNASRPRMRIESAIGDIPVYVPNIDVAVEDSSLIADATAARTLLTLRGGTSSVGYLSDRVGSALRAGLPHLAKESGATSCRGSRAQPRPFFGGQSTRRGAFDPCGMPGAARSA